MYHSLRDAKPSSFIGISDDPVLNYAFLSSVGLPLLPFFLSFFWSSFPLAGVADAVVCAVVNIYNESSRYSASEDGGTTHEGQQ